MKRHPALRAFGGGVIDGVLGIPPRRRSAPSDQSPQLRVVLSPPPRRLPAVCGQCGAPNPGLRCPYCGSRA